MYVKWVNGTAGETTSSLLDELLWVAKLIENDVSRELNRKNRLFVRIIRRYFWLLAFVSFAQIPVLVTI